MSVGVGTHLGSLEITALIGRGGMGEVYRARDLKLKREVAIKILPEEFSRDPDRVSRFQREAEVLASLNHPNIATIHGLEESGDQQFLVMELVAGETLAEKLTRGPVLVDEALRIALQIAEGLESAHEKGIIHRDLKPANIKITPEGKVKILDFGLAKAFEPDTSSAALSNSPTLSGAATNAGMILGTAAYMSPEQAKGLAADLRSDVFSFGCILYEILTGKAAFEGDTVSEILASVLKSEPDLQRLPPNLNTRLRETIERTLAKNAKRRFYAIGDVRFELERASKQPLDSAPHAAAVKTNSPLAWIVAAIATLGFAAIAVLHFRGNPAPDLPEMRLEINTPSTTAPLEFALSPDGRYIVFVASGDGPQRLWLRPLDKTEAQPLVGTEGADSPFWSADSRSIGFTAAGKLQRIDIAGGTPQVLTSTGVTRSGAWNADGTILFNTLTGPLYRIAASGGGDPVVLKQRTRPFLYDSSPQFLPDGRHFLFFSVGSREGTGVYLGSLDEAEPKRLTDASSSGVPLGEGMIAFVRGTSLIAQHFNLKRGELTGDPIRLADPVGYDGNGLGGFSASADGRLAYRGGGGLRQLQWYDRSGKGLGAAAASDPATPAYPELSPDGTHLTFQRFVQGNTDVWLSDLARGGMTRFTVDAAIDSAPIWSPDGARIAFYSSRKSGIANLYVKPSSAATAEELLLETTNNKYTQDWSKDGRFLLYCDVDPKTGRDLWALPLTGNDKKPIVVVNTPFEELNGQFSPNGHWVAYQTDESGRFEIVVQTFPVGSGKWQVSTGGGIQPRWRADGKELYFVAPDRKLMAASVTAGATFTAETPVPLFTVTLPPGGAANRQQYAVSRDGRFLITQPAEASSTTPITVILNWKPKP
jgi:serine/threonine protein kinase/Tol biopolymer transport system component